MENVGYVDCIHLGVDGKESGRNRYRRAGCCALVNSHFTASGDDNRRKYRKVLVYIPFSYVAKRTEDDIKKWISFCTKAGMPCKYLGVGKMDNSNIGDSYGGMSSTVAKGDCYLVEIDGSKVMNGKHGLAIFSCIRYLWSPYYTGIVERALDIKQTCPSWSYIKCLHMAHYDRPKLYSQGYGLTYDVQASVGTYVFRPIGLKEFKARMKDSSNFVYINDVFSPAYSNNYKPKVSLSLSESYKKSPHDLTNIRRINATITALMDMCRNGEYKKLDRILSDKEEFAI